MDPNLQAVLLWQHHQTTTPFLPSVGGAGTRAAGDPATGVPPAEEDNGEEEEEENNEEEEEQSGEKH